MKSLLKLPNEELRWPIGWLVFLCIIGAVGSFTGGDLSLVLFCVSVITGILAIGLWQESMIAIWSAMVLFGTGAVMRLALLPFNFKWTSLAYAAVSLSIVWSCWDARRALTRARFEGLPDWEPDFLSDQTSDSEQSSESDEMSESDEVSESKDDPRMVSLALLQRQPKYLEARVLAAIVTEAWGQTYTGESPDEDEDAEKDADADEDAVVNDDPDESKQGDAPGRSVMGENPIYFVTSDIGIFMVNNYDVPYWDDVDAVVEEIGELRLRKRVAEHTAWLSVDWMGASSPETDESEAYAWINRLILELADEDTLAILRPEAQELNVWTGSLAERLATRDGHLQIAKLDNTPVIPIEDGDPRMSAAVESARERWPEFVAAFERNASGDENFAIKVRLTVDEVTEYIWLDFLGAEPKFLHGRLANDPVDLGTLALGDQVEVPVENLMDWGFVSGGQPQGFFSVQAMQEILSERKQD